MEGEADDFLGRLFSFGKGFFCAGEICEDALLVEGFAIVNGAGYVDGFERFAEAVAVLGADGVLCVDVGITGVNRWCADVVFEGIGVTCAYFLAQGDLFVPEVGELGLDDGGLQAVAAAVGAEDVVRLALFAAVISDRAEGFGKCGVGSEDGPSIAIATEWLGREEAGAGDCADGATFTTVLLGSEALSGVFDNLQAVLFGDGFEGGVIGHLAEEVDCDDGLGLGRNYFCHLLGIDIVSVGLNVGEDGGGADEGNGLGGADPGEGRGYDFVSGADAECAEGNFECHGATRHGDAVEGL